jgi:hypothetical protein
MAAPAGGPALGGGGIGDLKKMMDASNAEATQRSIVNIQDQQKKEEIQGVNQAAKGGHDLNAEVNRNVK